MASQVYAEHMVATKVERTCWEMQETLPETGLNLMMRVLWCLPCRCPVASA